MKEIPIRSLLRGQYLGWASLQKRPCAMDVRMYWKCMIAKRIVSNHKIINCKEGYWSRKRWRRTYSLPMESSSLFSICEVTNNLRHTEIPSWFVVCFLWIPTTSAMVGSEGCLVWWTSVLRRGLSLWMPKDIDPPYMTYRELVIWSSVAIREGS